MAEDERSVGRPGSEDDSDQVDLSWVTNGLRRLGLIGAPRPPRPLPAPRPPRSARSAPVEQLALFEGPPAPRRRPDWWPAFWSGADPDSDPDAPPASITKNQVARLIVLVAVVTYSVVFLRWSFRQHDGIGTLAFDVGIFDQGVWLLSRFKSPFITVNGRNLFGDHTSFILLPFAAVYWLIPSIKVLLAAQTLALALGAVPTFLIARDKLRSEMLGAVLAVAYLLQPVVGWANLSESFHPDSFEIPLVLFTIWFCLRHRWVGYWVCVALLLLVKEDVALLTFGLGVYVALREDRRVGLITCGISVAYLAAAFWIIIPAFLGGGTVYTGRLLFGGPTGLLKKVFTDPGEVISEVFDRKRAWYLWQLFAPVAFLAWLAPAVLLIAAGPLIMNLISGFGYQFDVRYHYSTLILPIIVVATIFGVASMPRRNHHALVGVVMAASLVCGWLWSPLPVGRVHPYVADPSSTAAVSFRQAEELLPDDAVVSAYYGFVPQLSHRDEVYVFPNPWKASYWGTFDQEGQRLDRADGVEYIFVRSSLDPEPQAVFDSIVGEFETLYHDAEVQLLRRRA